MKGITKKIVSIITSLLIHGSCSTLKALDEHQYSDFEDLSDDYEDDTDDCDLESDEINICEILNLVKNNPIRSALIFGSGIVMIKKMYNLMKYVGNCLSYIKICGLPDNMKLYEYCKLIGSIANKATNFPDISDKVNCFMKSFDESTVINDSNIAEAVLCVSWYARCIGYGVKNSGSGNKLTNKLSKISEKIFSHLGIEKNALKLLGAGSNGVAYKAGEDYYKITLVRNNNIENYIKGAKLNNKINQTLSDSKNEYIKIYKSDKLNYRSEKLGAGILQLDYLEPTDMKTTEDLFRCIEDLCEGLKYLHDNGLVYKDIKLDNTVITKESGKIRLRIIDPDDIDKENTKTVVRNLARTRFLDLLPFKGATKSLDIYMVGNTIEELLLKYKKTKGTSTLSVGQESSIRSFINKCHAFFNDNALDEIISAITNHECCTHNTNS